MKWSVAVACAALIGISGLRCEAVGGRPVHALHQKARLLVSQGKLKEALAMEQQGAELDPRDNLPHRGMTFIYLQTGQLDLALREARLAFTLAPRDAATAYNLGRVLQAQSKFSESLAAYQQCIKLQPSDLNAKLGAAQCLMSLNRIDEAIELLEPASNYSGVSAEIWTDLAIAYMNKENLADAEHAATMALRVNPRSYEATRILAQIELAANNLKEATAQARHLVALSPENRNGYLFLLRCLKRQPLSISESNLILEKSHQYLPADAALFYSLGVYFMDASSMRPQSSSNISFGNKADWLALAERAFRYASQAAPNEVQGHLALSTALTFQGKLSEALAEAKRARDIDPSNPVVQNQIAQIGRQSNDLAANLKLALHNLFTK